jgi:hypothetical protein
MFQRLKRLQQKRQSMPEDMAWVFFIQLCLGIQSLHRNNILHRCESTPQPRRSTPPCSAVRVSAAPPAT